MDNEMGNIEEQIVSEMEQFEGQDSYASYDTHNVTNDVPENEHCVGIPRDWDKLIDMDDDDDDPWIDKEVTGKEAFEYQRRLRGQKNNAKMLIGYDTESIMKAAVRNWIDANRKLLNLPLLLDNRGVKRKCVLDGKWYTYYVPVMEAIRTEILSEYDKLRIEANDALKKSDSTKLKKLDDLPGWVIADILVATGGVRVLNTKHGLNTVGTDHLIYKDYFKSKWTNGKMKWSGQWRQYQDKTPTDQVNKFFRELNPSATSGDKEDFVTRLYSKAPVSYINARNDIIFWRNGIWDYTLKKFTNYDDDDYEELYGDVICMAKYAVNHPLGRMWGNQKPMKFDANGNCIEPVYKCHDGSKWSPSIQLKAPFRIGTPQGDASYDCVVRFFQFTLRGMNGYPYYYLVWIDGIGGGMNGKSTTGDALELMMKSTGLTDGCEDLHCENLILDISMEELAHDHNLNSSLLYARWIRGQESGGATKCISAEDCKAIKLLSRVQPVRFRDLYDMPMSIAFDGGLTQEINSFPILAEKTGSMMAHILTIPYDVSFGLSKPYIKSDFMRRLEVRSWMAWYFTTQLPCYEAYDDNSTNILRGNSEEVLRENMNTVQFFDEVLPMINMNVMPPELLHPLYQNWCQIHGYTGSQCVTKKSFVKDMQQYATMSGSKVDFTVAQRRMSTNDVKFQQMNGDKERHCGMEAIRRYGYDKHGNPLPFVLMGNNYNTDSYTERSDMLDWSYFGDVKYFETIPSDKPNMRIEKLTGLKQFRNCFVRKVSVYKDPTQCVTTYTLDDDEDEDDDE
jgi:hypothetical protein